MLGALPGAAAAVLLLVASIGEPSREAPPEGIGVRGLHTVERNTIGLSVEGRSIVLHCAGEGDRVALFIGGLHTGGEVNSSHLAHAFIQRMPEMITGSSRHDVRACVVPLLNPDGLARDEHHNARGVDLNRNWPTDDWASEAYHPTRGTVPAGDAPLSEPETIALYRLLTELQPDVLVTWHCCGNLVEPNRAPRAERYARLYAAASGYDYLHEWSAYEITGELLEAAEALDVPAMDVELTRVGEIDLKQNLAAIEALLVAIAGLP